MDSSQYDLGTAPLWSEVLRLALRRTADEEASPAAWLEEGVVVRVHQCPHTSPF